MTSSASLAQALIWTSIVLCAAQSAVFSGLNLAIFSVSKLRLEVEAAGGNLDATRVLDLRMDSNFTLSTILWGNTVTNVLLTLLSDSLLAGLGAFVFSTFAIYAGLCQISWRFTYLCWNIPNIARSRTGEGRVEEGRTLTMGFDRSIFCGMKPEFSGASVNHILLP
jgi:hypothetical protein